MADLWTSKLSEYVDGTLPAADRQALEGHLADCAECRVILDDLRRIVSGASALGDRAPATDLWAGIADRIRPSVRDIRDFGRHRRWRISLSIPQLAAAGIVLVAVSFALASRWGPGAQAPRVPMDGGGQMPALTAAAHSEAVFDQAVAELQQILESGRGSLDSTTIRALETNLAIIDRAIAQARQAVLADSANGYLRDHLEQTQRRKLVLMRRAADLIAVAS